MFAAIEADLAKHAAATKQAEVYVGSEVDWEGVRSASDASECMITKATHQGLHGALAGALLDACAPQGNPGQDVDKLNARQAEIDTLSWAQLFGTSQML